MKQLVTFALVLLSLALASPSRAADLVKIGLIDIQKVLLLSEAGKAGKEQLTAKADRLEKQKELLAGELEKLKTLLEKEGVPWSEAEKGAKETEYARKLQEYQQFMKDAEDEFQAKNEELTKAILEEIVKAIDDYGRKNGYALILIKNEYVIYIDEKTDLTGEIVNILNMRKKAGSRDSGT